MCICLVVCDHKEGLSLLEASARIPLVVLDVDGRKYKLNVKNTHTAGVRVESELVGGKSRRHHPAYRHQACNSSGARARANYLPGISSLIISFAHVVR